MMEHIQVVPSFLGGILGHGLSVYTQTSLLDLTNLFYMEFTVMNPSTFFLAGYLCTAGDWATTTALPQTVGRTRIALLLFCTLHARLMRRRS
ncbi:hypothetical protein BD779DRAFT_1557563 [Infundibulicybe gibba]|nr:hypothetical protein BD779DRAFT_1557563 [Infundibulicybe gibba]